MKEATSTRVRVAIPSPPNDKSLSVLSPFHEQQVHKLVLHRGASENAHTAAHREQLLRRVLKPALRVRREARADAVEHRVKFFCEHMSRAPASDSSVRANYRPRQSPEDCAKLNWIGVAPLSFVASCWRSIGASCDRWIFDGGSSNDDRMLCSHTHIVSVT